MIEWSSLGQSIVTLLGTESQCEHSDSLRAMLAGRVVGTSSICDSPTHQKGRPVVAWRRRWNRFSDQLWGTSDSEYLRYVTRVIDECESKIVIGYWGTIPLPDLLAIKKARPQVKVVLMLLCYPLALTGGGIARQDFFLRRSMRFLDGIIFSTEVMQQYIRERTSGHEFPLSAVIPPCWPAEFQSQRELPAPAGHPNLIYVGRTDLSSKTIHVADDIRSLMRGVLEAGIELHHVYSRETDDGHPFRKLFQPRTMLELIEMMGQFDASLIAYNAQACARDDRFQMTVPDRLVSSVAAGIPIAIPRQGYRASKEYLRNYPAMIEFDSARELAAVLSDRSRVAALREAAWQARSSYAAAAHGPALERFLEQLV